MKNKILIVEDLYANRYLLEEIFDEYEVHSASDGSRMRELLKSVTPDIIIMDVNLPEQDGFELARELKADPATADISIIFLTVHNTKLDVINAIKSGGSDFIVKPFDEQDIKNRVEKTLRERILKNIPEK